MHFHKPLWTLYLESSCSSTWLWVFCALGVFMVTCHLIVWSSVWPTFANHESLLYLTVSYTLQLYNGLCYYTRRCIGHKWYCTVSYSTTYLIANALFLPFFDPYDTVSPTAVFLSILMTIHMIICIELMVTSRKYRCWVNGRMNHEITDCWIDSWTTHDLQWSMHLPNCCRDFPIVCILLTKLPFVS